MGASGIIKRLRKLAEASGSEYVSSVVRDIGNLEGEGDCWFLMLGERPGLSQQYRLCERIQGNVHCVSSGDRDKVYGAIDTMLHYYDAKTDWHLPDPSKYLDVVEDLKDETGRPTPMTGRFGPRNITRQ